MLTQPLASPDTASPDTVDSTAFVYSAPPHKGGETTVVLLESRKGCHLGGSALLVIQAQT